MKICLLGSAPSSLGLAPFGDPDTLIWACSPGTYHQIPRCDAFFELHRREVGLIGKPATQKPWFSPEYVAWINQQAVVWVAPKAVPEWQAGGCAGALAYPIEEMAHKWGDYFWTSSLSYMFAMAIDQILAYREKNPGHNPADDLIALFGVDMAATEEYGYQRAGCQFFASMAVLLNIRVYTPPESDLLRPMPRYALDESEDWHIKGLARRRELEGQLQHWAEMEAQAARQKHFINGALDDHGYHMNTWMTDREMKAPNMGILAASPGINAILRKRFDEEKASSLKLVGGTDAPAADVVDVALARSHVPQGFKPEDPPAA